MAAPQGTQDAFTYAVHSHRRHSPKHAHTVVKQLHGQLRRLDMRLDDDVALAACQILDVMPTILGSLKHLQRWAEVVNQCEPHEAPEKGARLCS